VKKQNKKTCFNWRILVYRLTKIQTRNTFRCSQYAVRGRQRSRLFLHVRHFSISVVIRVVICNSPKELYFPSKKRSRRKFTNRWLTYTPSPLVVIPLETDYCPFFPVSPFLRIRFFTHVIHLGLKDQGP